MAEARKRACRRKCDHDDKNDEDDYSRADQQSQTSASELIAPVPENGAEDRECGYQGGDCVLRQHSPNEADRHQRTTKQASPWTVLTCRSPAQKSQA